MGIMKYVVNKLSDRMARPAIRKAEKSMRESDVMLKMIKAKRGYSPQREKMKKTLEANYKAGKYSNGIGVGY